MSNSLEGRVFIVEDDMLLSMVEERLITRLGYNVIGKADKGIDAVEQVRELKPDVIVMDISLKGDMDGIETMEMIREQSTVPVIYLSGSADRYHYERAKKTGFTEFLTKPVTSGDLKGPLHDALQQGNAEYSDSENMRFNRSA